MFGKHHSVRKLQRSGFYNAWTLLLIITLLGAGALVPPKAQAAAPPTATTAAPLAQAVASEDTGPEAVVPDVPAKNEVSGRSRYSRTERNPDGTYTATFSQRPLHWQDERGEWREFVNELKPSTQPGYSHQNTSNGYRASFGKPTDVAVGRPVLRLESEGASLVLEAVGAKPSASQASGSRLLYTEAYPDTDIRYTVDNERIKEEVVLKKAPATEQAAIYKYDLELSGVTATKKADNSIVFNDSSGKVIYRIPRPFMLDSSRDPEKAYSDDIQVTLTQLSEGKHRLEYAPSLTWLRDASRVYPVVLDPTVEQVTYTAAGGQDVHLYECCPTQNTAGSAVVHVGKNSSGQRRDTLIQFPELTTLPQDTVVTTAYLKMYADTGTDNLPMEIHAVTNKDWTETDATWGSMPLDTTMGKSIYGSPSSSVPGWNNMWVTGLVRYWVRGTLPNHGFRIFSNGTENQSVAFRSGDNTDAATRPQLQVNYVPATRYGIHQLWTYTEHDYGTANTTDTEGTYGGGNTSATNISTGNLVFQHEDGFVDMKGFLVKLGHIYNSQDPYGQTSYYDKTGAVYGEGWTFTQNIRLYATGDGAMVLKDEQGVTWVYAANGSSGSYFTPSHYNYILKKDTASGEYTLTLDGGGDTLYFDSGGKLTRRDDHNLDYLTYAYDTSGRLSSITDMNGAAISLRYEGPGTPGRLSQITEPSGRVSTYGYDADGDLTRITHDVGTTQESTTGLGYGIAHHLISVTNPSGQKSDIYYKIEHSWDAAGASDGYRPEGRATAVSQSTERAFRGAGSLRVDLSDVTSTTVSSAARIYSTPVEWNSTQQGLLAHVYVPSGYSLNARLMLRDSRNNVVYGPWLPASGGVWTQIRLPDAHVDLGYQVTKVSVQFVTPSGAPNYTGSVWVDHVLLKGVMASVTNGITNPASKTSMSYDWAVRMTTESNVDEAGALQNIGYAYDRYGSQIVTADPAVVVGEDGSSYTPPEASLADAPPPPEEETMLETQAIIGSDNRVWVSDTTAPPYRRIVHIAWRERGTGATGHCTGWLSNKNTVITAGHCLWSPNSTRRWRDPIAVHAGLNGSFAPYPKCGWRAMWVSNGWWKAVDYRYDYGAIKLNCTIGNTVGWWRYKPVIENRQYRQSRLSGYPGDKGSGSLRGKYQYKSISSIQSQGVYNLFYWNDMVPGDSGAPVWEHKNEYCSTDCVIAINSINYYPNEGVLITQAVYNAIIYWNNVP